MKKLSDMLARLDIRSVSGSADVDVADVCYDSRRAQPGTVFVALRGAAVDGHRFIPDAVARGCAAVVAEDLPTEGIGVAWVSVPDSRVALAELAAAFFGDPSTALPVVGVTGTNGKTTTACLVHHLVSASLHRCGLVGTVCYDDGSGVRPAERTTPESRDLQELLAAMRDNGCRAAAMEVSSHSVVQHRIRAVRFAAGVFTNLTQDHLDYHGGMDAYFEAKAGFFEQMASAGADRPGHRGRAVINTDDAYGRRLLKRFADRLDCTAYGLGVHADFRATGIRTGFDGTTFQLEAKGRSFLVRLPLIGAFNVYNALAALAAGNAIGLNLRESVDNLARAPQVPGRLESVAERRAFKVFVDYAHTPDALENVLRTLRELEPARLITVFGCGGDRDRAKRPLMAAAAARFSDFVIATSDNPRGELPARILEDIRAGLGASRHRLIEDRREAIETAIHGAGEGDIVLIAGKGHETYQQFADRTVAFDDRVVARQCIDHRPDSKPGPHGRRTP